MRARAGVVCGAAPAKHPPSACGSGQSPPPRRIGEARVPGLPARLVLRDTYGRQIDFHPLAFDERGNGPLPPVDASGEVS